VQLHGCWEGLAAPPVLTAKLPPTTLLSTSLCLLRISVCSYSVVGAGRSNIERSIS
jgi:hypothetical protein